MCDNWQETAQMFSSLFEKPKMSEKLLSKPPFKYLFDIFKETQKATGFGKGLFNEQEQDSAYYDNRDKKIDFLKRIIDVTGLCLKQEFHAKPTKIVAGLEPQQTNILLQGLYKAAMSIENSAPYVQKALELNGQAPPPAAQEEEKPKPKPKKQQEEDQTIKKVQKKKIVVEDERKPQKSQQQETRQPRDDEEDNQEDIQQSKPKKDYSKQPHSKLVNEALAGDDEDLAERKQPEQKVESSGTGIKMKKRLGQKKPVEETQKRSSQNDQPGSSTVQIRKQENLEDVEYLSKLVQQICQNANPLGKSLEFIQDDIESMNNELKHWNQQYQGYKDRMQSELRITEENLSPLQDKLTEIELSISDEKAKIQNMKSQILKNKYTISTLLHSVVATK